MKWSVSLLLWVGGGLLFTAATTAVATQDNASINYRIELQVPEAQRKLLQDHLDLYRWRGNERMDETQLVRLVRLAPDQIRTFLAAEGFYTPTVTAVLEQRGDAWVARLVVEPGEPVRVSTVQLQVSGPFDDGSAENRARFETIRSEWALPPRAVFRHDDWEAAKRKALKALLLDRYPTATISESRATVDPEAKTAALQLTLDSGPAFTFGTLDIHGLRRYPKSIIERLNPISPGEPYAQAKLLALQSRLQDSQYFATATVGVDSDRDHPLDMPIRVDVTENQSKKLGFGIGTSTDTGARGQVDYRDLNFFDSAWRLGGTLKLEQKRQLLSGNLQFPLTESGHRDSMSVQFESTDIQGEITRKTAIESRRTFARGRTETSYGLRYLTEAQEIAGIRTNHNAALSPFYSWILRVTDHPLYPTRGYLLNLQANVAVRKLLSDQSFLRGYSRLVYFHPIGKHGQFILRGELGAVVAPSRDGIPSDFLFRAGGDQSVRGYSYQSLGIQEGNAIVGGRYLALASVEYVHWLTSQWGAAVFVDGGNAGDSLKDLNPVYGYGFGGRWKSPVGPLNLDIAYGQETKEVRLHFSVGFNF